MSRCRSPCGASSLAPYRLSRTPTRHTLLPWLEPQPALPGPTATHTQTRGASLIDHLVRPEQKRLRDRQAECLGGLHVDDQLESGWLLDRQVGWLGTLEDFVHIGRGAPIQISL